MATCMLFLIWLGFTVFPWIWVDRRDDEGSGKDKVTWAYLNQVRAQGKPEAGSETKQERKEEQCVKDGPVMEEETGRKAAQQSQETGKWAQGAGGGRRRRMMGKAHRKRPR